MVRRPSLKQFAIAISFGAFFYFILGNFIVPSRSRITKPRDLLSIHNRASWKKADKAHGSEQLVARHTDAESFEALVDGPMRPESAEASRERMRSPDPALQRMNMSSAGEHSQRTAYHSGVADGSLISDVSDMEQLASLINRSGLCPDIADNPQLRGPLGLATLLIENLKEAEIQRRYPFLKVGGHWKPEKCKARYKVAIIIPYRDRQSHLVRLIDFLVPILVRQFLDFRFIVTEQFGNDLFNKGRIMNAAFRLAEKLGVDCVIFHDVDMFPQDDRVPYGCPSGARHIGAFVDNLGYQLWYEEIVGGALAMNMEDYRTVNGYSNLYWAWGGEDDDMGSRILANNYTIERPDPAFCRYSMLKHVKRKRTSTQTVYRLLDTAKTRWQTDGLNVKLWNVTKVIIKPLYYHMYVDVGTPPDKWKNGQK
ncbi:hypothetical protein AB6A40_007124 [Gnathostoma spinigerum]|uniref:Beta-1,4-N-acetylgalactosaminyltransferase n=1 Tax=Gnathostoma spinigerum TaxID=75299 RepID=A0ABD6EVY3_9BILA